MKKLLILAVNVAVIGMLLYSLPSDRFEKGLLGIILILTCELIMYRIYVLSKTGKGFELGLPFFMYILPLTPIAASLLGIIGTFLLFYAYKFKPFLGLFRLN